MGLLSVAFVTRSAADNSLGRTYSLWLLAQRLGWRARVYAPHGSSVWGPLQGTEFASSVHLVHAAEISAGEIFSDVDLVIAVKPLRETFGLARVGAARARTPLLLDIDDPDLEGRLSFERPFRALARELRYFRRQSALRELRRLTRRVPVIVSNPVLQARYGGTVIGHARNPDTPGDIRETTSPTVAFVGTDNPHKGLPVLREAVAALAPTGFRLVITAPPPPDECPWERWLGQTSLTEGLAQVRASDIVAIPSLDRAFARGQLPAKAIDAMFAGRAIVASDIPPMGWALDGSGLLVEPGSVDELSGALATLADPALRRELGARARRSALDRFSVDALAEPFEHACRDAASAHAEIGRGS